AVGRHDNFFERGGHSLLAARVIARINSRFGKDLPLRMLFESTTLAALAGQLEQKLQSADEVEYLPIERRDPAQPAPLSFAQEQLWYLHEVAPPNAAYNLSGALELQGMLDQA